MPPPETSVREIRRHRSNEYEQGEDRHDSRLSEIGPDRLRPSWPRGVAPHGCEDSLGCGKAASIKLTVRRVGCLALRARRVPLEQLPGGRDDLAREWLDLLDRGPLPAENDDANWLLPGQDGD